MNTNKHIAYKIWLDELNTIPSQDFFPTFRQILELLEKENPSKINKLIDIFDKETRRLVNYGNKAVQELEPLLQEVESIIKDEKTHMPSKIQEYKDIKDGKIQIMGEDLPDTLYHAIRLTLEDYRSTSLKEKFSHLISAEGNITYLDYEKMCKVYPIYRQFRKYKDIFEKSTKEEPWGAHVYLRWATGFFKDVFPEQAGSFVKTDIISNLRRLILYLLIPEAEEKRELPSKITGIDKLFSLSLSPTAIYYAGQVKEKRKWIYPKGKVQPYAILKLASEKYQRQQAKGSTNLPHQIKLSYVEIEEYITNPKNCDRQPNWKGIATHKRRLEHLRKNILRLVPFASNELRLEKLNQTACLIFQSPS